jgi:hypothetical protein
MRQFKKGLFSIRPGLTFGLIVFKYGILPQQYVLKTTIRKLRATTCLCPPFV